MSMCTKRTPGNKRVRYLLLPPLVVLGLVGILASCGGSGGGGGGGGAGFNGGAGGTAAKGIIKAGSITAEELATNGSVVRSVGTATTDDNGDYALTLSSDYGGGPLLLSIVADGSSSMVCDVQPDCGLRSDDISDANGNGTVDFGEELRVADLNMTALLPAVSSGATVTTHITPFTHMIATRARAATTLDTTAVDAATSELANLLGGLDVLRLKPVNLASSSALADASEAERTYAALLAGVGELAYGSAGVGARNAIDFLAASFQEGRIGADAALGSGQFSLQQIVDAMDSQLSKLGMADTLGLSTSMRTKIANAGTGGTVDPEPSPNAGNTDIAKAKALVQEARNWIRQIEGTGSAVDAFATEVDMAVSVGESSFGATLSSLAQVVGIMWDAYFNATGDGTTEHPSWVDDESGLFDPSGIVGGGGNIAITGMETPVTTITLSGTIISVDNVESVTFTTEDVSLSMTLPSLSAAPISDVSGTINGTVANDAESLSVDGTASVSFSSAVDPVNDLEPFAKMQNADLDISGTMQQLIGDNPVRFTGDVEFTGVRFGAGEEDFNPSRVSLNGTVSNNTNSFGAIITATSEDAASFDRNQDETASNFPRFALSIGFTGELEGLPESEVTLTVNRTGFDATAEGNFIGNGSLILSRGSVTTRLDASRLQGTSLWSGALTFTSQDGAQLIASGSDEDEAVWPITVNGNTVGSATEILGGVIKVSYDDGTFETLN